jgi:hypothetical protein
MALNGCALDDSVFAEHSPLLEALRKSELVQFDIGNNQCDLDVQSLGML